ncbi:MAG: hypothetical protein JSU09_01695 [Bacteroidetes bacterium]|nr:hypothetical protein [Bacteroidota bacterium]
MSWSTVYIKGKVGFEREVISQLEKSGFSFLPGTEENGLSLFWIDNLAKLHEFKIAIGSKTILRYRLRFFTNLEEADQMTTFTSDEKSKIKKMQEWDRLQKSA